MLIVERQPLSDLSEPAIDGRDIALTHFSQKLMTEMDTWSRMPEEDVFPIYVSADQAHHNPSTDRNKLVKLNNATLVL